MLNFKKGLAIVLAAATALTFAPVANLGTAVDANAATEFRSAQNVQLTVGESITYAVNVSDLADGTKFKITNSDSSVVETKVLTGYASGTQTFSTVGATTTKFNNDSSIYVTALKAGTSTIHITYYGSNKAELTKDITFTVVNKSNVPVWQIGRDSGAFASISSYGYPATNVANDYTLKLPGAADDGTQYAYAAGAVKSSDESIVKVTTANSANTPGTNTTAKLQFIKKGSVTLTIKATADGRGATKLSGEQTFSVVINVIANGSNLTVGDSKNISAGDRVPTYSGSPAAWSNVDKTVYLNAANPSQAIGATLEDPQSTDEKLVYTAYKETSNTAAAIAVTDKTKEIEVSADGTITATANALNSSEQYYFVKVSNNLTDGSEKTGWVRVVTTRNEKAFASIKVDIDGQSKTAKAKYAADGSTADDVDQAIDINMSTADKTSVPYTVTSSNNTEVKSNDTTTVDVVNGTLVAKRVGVAQVTFATKTDTTHYGNAKITVRVNVTNQKLNAKVVAEKSAITLTKTHKSEKIKASVVTTPALAKQPALSFRFVTKKDDGTYEKATPADFDIAADGTVTYKTTAEATATVEVSTAATNDYAEPAKAYVTVKGTQKKEDSKLNVTTKALNLTEAETGNIVATGTALSYKSSDDSIATVDATGKVTAVKAGVAVITVSDAGNDEFADGSADVTVYVKAAPVVYEDPAQVTGVKIKNAKGAKVTVTFTKDETNPNMKYYVQKQTQKKKSGKTVGSNKTTLSVKKGKSVKVRVKAYYYDANGVKHVGKYSAWTSIFKTDKK